MFLKIVSLFDKKAQIFSPMNAVPNTNAFIRVLSDEIARPDSNEIWAKHPEDFQLFELGLFNDETGQIELQITQLCEMSTLVKSV